MTTSLETLRYFKDTLVRQFLFRETVFANDNLQSSNESIKKKSASNDADVIMDHVDNVK